MQAGQGPAMGLALEQRQAAFVPQPWGLCRGQTASLVDKAGDTA